LEISEQTRARILAGKLASLKKSASYLWSRNQVAEMDRPESLQAEMVSRPAIFKAKTSDL